jgi:hypothetical protein
MAADHFEGFCFDRQGTIDELTRSGTKQSLLVYFRDASWIVLFVLSEPEAVATGSPPSQGYR